MKGTSKFGVMLQLLYNHFVCRASFSDVSLESFIYKCYIINLKSLNVESCYQFIDETVWVVEQVSETLLTYTFPISKDKQFAYRGATQSISFKILK